jgi:hypothetical protein
MSSRDAAAIQLRIAAHIGPVGHDQDVTTQAWAYLPSISP